MTAVIATVRPRLRRAGLPLLRALDRMTLLRLHYVHLKDGIAGVQVEVRKLRRRHADALRAFGADIAPDAAFAGPLSIVNAARDFSNLSVAANTHIGADVFLDLADAIVIEDGATISMRTIIITHFDAGRSPIAERRPRRSGPVRIGAGAYIGAGAIILHGVTIGREALIGAGVVVTQDVPDGAIVRPPAAG